MKKVPFFLAFLLLVFAAGLLNTSCRKDKDDDPIIVPYQGRWEGLTSQDTTIIIDVGNVNDKPAVIHYKLVVIFHESGGIGYTTREESNSEGICAIVNGYFSILLGTGESGPALLEGSFNAYATSLSGNFSHYFPGSSTQKVYGNYQIPKTP
ncbi:MAG: hypothetical protein FJY10_10995 [Bacteroidetes bacterium]|nr:hypothetical protein [Bacteroidota bacterium]